jgi:ketosteroid isomerase-like protein
MYTPEADFVSVRGEIGTGKAEAEKGLARIFATRAKTAVLKTENVQIRFIRPDVALVHVTNELSGLVNADGQALPSHRELSLRVFVKDAAVLAGSILSQHDSPTLRLGTSKTVRFTATRSDRNCMPSA